MNKTRVHILGASGFVGNSLYKNFSADSDFDVKGYSSQDCNLLFYNSVSLTLPRFNSDDVVIMASSITRLKENSLESMTKNIKMADNISRFIKENLPGQFIFLSTADVYGINPTLPIHEKLLPNPNDHYAISKLSSEFILKSTCSNKGIPLLTLRLSGMYGNGDDGISTINRLVKSAINGKIILANNGLDRRDFFYVDDLHKLIKEGIDKRTDLTVNVATGENYSIGEIAELIKFLFSGKVSVEYEERKDSGKRIGEMRFDTKLLGEIFPKIRFTDIKSGLSFYIQKQKIKWQK
ncbi:MAG: NAD(P)-dependent oxidoreductase [Candidatus Pacearchaeota archaeon]|nr:NAD(P)-dependent oxidoreductase [Candidatus Pacearchaeota archaeon]